MDRLGQPAQRNLSTRRLAMDIPLHDALVHLSWNDELVVTEVRGRCPVLERVGRLRPGEPVHAALAVDQDQARDLDQRARTGGGVEFLRAGTGDAAGWVRLSLHSAGSVRHAWALDLDAVLYQAPPVQISRLSSSLSHELRNPLSSVKLSVQTLARNPDLSPRDQRRLTIAQREIRTLERMLTMLAEYGRDRPLILETVALRELVGQAVEAIAPELQGRHQSVQVEASTTLPPVKADPHRTRPVLAQLLLNIAAALPEGGVVEVRLLPDPAGGALLTVRDLAITLAADEQATAFEPFASRLARGAGLSLAALRQVMLHQNGRAEVHTDQKPGTLLTLAFAPG
jgi:two-component system sensor histidine kinase HydH